ncbi:hypothetical protein [Bradyrhizobium sp. AS23.2]|uniref:hypothetical protein n=1 Tax=Bradyrhizobium sp. AS23.2 TaxID=1680155 RepID=UPI00093F418D|nr:hypothetical protein [Bradyrhizobium sp. AS23.2]OKO67685.1 hypothetical protein AC630_40065 [Bradyrhizobium sp. AS23.2]
MSTKLRYVEADAVPYWTCGVKGWLLDGENYRIIPLCWSPDEYVAPPIEVGREMWEELERMASGD